MKDTAKIIGFIESGYECDYLDFKKGQYRENFSDLIIDIMAMANSQYTGDKYLILGIKDKPGEEREISGIDINEFIDSAIYQNIIMEYIEPEIKFDYFPIDYQDKKLGVIQIHENNNNRPYIVKKKYSYGQKGASINEGLCKVRKGSLNTFAKREDFDVFYNSKEAFEVKIMDNSLMAVYEDEGCARITITIRNLTKKPVVINYGLLTIHNEDGQLLSRHGVYGFDKEIVGADFKLSLSPMEERFGNLFVGFESSDCLRLKLDEYGTTEERFIFKLILMDTYDNEYVAAIEDGFVFAKGKVLWKVQLKAKKEEKSERTFRNWFSL